MAFLFGGERKTCADPVREHQQEIRRALRAMDREEARSVAADRALIKEITAHARDQKLPQCKAKAQQLVRARAHRARMNTMRGQLISLGQQLEVVKGTQQIHRVLEQTTALMRTLNLRVNPKAAHKLLADFERQNTAFVAGQEVMQETLDAVFEADDEHEASDDALSGIFMELGLSEAANLCRASASGDAGVARDDAQMEARLARLRAQAPP
jgi:hypothetical protein